MMRRMISTALCGLFLLSAPVFGQEWRQVAVLKSDAARDETILLVEFLESVDRDRMILIESRDRRYRVMVKIHEVYERHILLRERLAREFLQGALIYQ